MIRDVLEKVAFEEILRHVQALQGVRHPVAAPQGLAKAERYVDDTLAALGYRMSRHSFEDGGRFFDNIIATHPDCGSNQRVLVVAHLDTVSTSPGADDNASGVAVLLELARLLAPLTFAKTLQLVAVNLEECSGEDDTGVGTRGSRALANDARGEGWQIDAVVVLESVGFAGPAVVQSAPAGIPVEIPKTGDFIAVVGNEASADLVTAFARCIHSNNIALPCLPLVVPGNGELLPDTRRSDHAMFWDQGFPAIMLTDTSNFRSPHYHGPTDSVETLNIPFIVEVCRATVSLCAEVAGLLSPPMHS